MSWLLCFDKSLDNRGKRHIDWSSRWLDTFSYIFRDGCICLGDLSHDRTYRNNLVDWLVEKLFCPQMHSRNWNLRSSRLDKSWKIRFLHKLVQNLDLVIKSENSVIFFLTWFFWTHFLLNTSASVIANQTFFANTFLDARSWTFYAFIIWIEARSFAYINWSTITHFFLWSATSFLAFSWNHNQPLWAIISSKNSTHHFFLFFFLLSLMKFCLYLISHVISHAIFPDYLIFRLKSLHLLASHENSFPFWPHSMLLIKEAYAIRILNCIRGQLTDQNCQNKGNSY